MALEDFKKDELVKIADYFGTDTDGTKKEIVDRLEDDGVSFEEVEAQQEFIFPEVKVEKEPEEVTPVEVLNEGETREEDVPVIEEVIKPVVAENDLVLVKMLTNNRIFEIAGKRFTRNHPYVLMDRKSADKVLQNESFREANYKEAEDYYS
jgi:hypothetical protein